MKNHMFIGLGGQGGHSMAELRRVFEQRSRDATELRDEHGVKWEYLSIDSSRDVWDSGKVWRSFGKDVSLSDSQRFELDLLTDVEGLTVRPDVSRWIGDVGALRSFLGTAGRVSGANQRRRFGRLMFANNADPIRAALRTQTEKLTHPGVNQCAFHVFASLAGGTGSGGLIDLISTIRSEYPQGDVETGFPIFLYLFVTANDGAASDVGYFYQNQYAALRDLNAMICGRMAPVRLGAQSSGDTVDCQDSVATACLFTSLNGRNMTLSLSNQIRIAAEACVERIYSLASGGLAQNPQKAVTGQDTVVAFGGEPHERPERSYRFGSLGMRRWEVPGEKLREVVALDLMISGLQQMLYHHWVQEQGFAETRTEPNQAKIDLLVGTMRSMASEAAVTAMRESLATEMRRDLDEIAVGVSGEEGEKRSLATLEEETQRHMQRVFQGDGIVAFFQGVELKRPGTVSKLVARIDDFLTDQWRDSGSGVGLVDLPGILDHLTANLRSGATTDQNDGTGRERLSRRRQARKGEWMKLAYLSRIVGKDKALLSAHLSDLKNEWSAELGERCAREDEELFRELGGHLESLSRHYQAAIGAIDEERRSARLERDSILAELDTMRAPGGANRYEFDLDGLNAFREMLRKDRPRQVSSAAALRRVVVPPPERISRFRQGGGGGKKLELINSGLRVSAAETVDAVHLEYVNSATIETVLDASLLDRLAKRFAGDRAALVAEARDFVSLAASCMLIDPTETQPAVLLGGGTGVPPMPKRVMVLAVPNGDFGQTIEEVFREVIPAGQMIIHDTYRHSDVTQLRLLVMDYWMAARFSATVKELAGKYNRTASQDGRNHVRYFCNIDPDGEEGKRPSLLEPRPEERKRRLEAELWLGPKLPEPVIQIDEHGVSLITRNSEGINSENLGPNSGEVIRRADIPLMAKVDAAVRKELAKVGADEKAALRKEVGAEEDRMKEAHLVTSPEFREWARLRDELYQLLV